MSAVAPPSRRCANPPGGDMNENFSLILMVVAIVLSLGFLADQMALYH
jgi:hypothetical protein